MRVRGTAQVPRLSVFRSLRHCSAQLIDDEQGVTIASATDAEMKPEKKGSAMSPRERAAWVGREVAKRAKTKGITAARFDRGHYRYHGLIAAIAESARAGGLKL